MEEFAERKRRMKSLKRVRERRVRMKHSLSSLEELFDLNTFHQIYGNIASADPLKFPGYRKKLKESRKKTDLLDAVAAGYGKIGGITVFAAMMNKDFLMGSLGSAAGEVLTRTIESAGKRGCPLIIISASGGARMQEGMYSLLQMAKTSAAIARYKEEGGLYISVLTHPTTGGVSASFAMLGDVILAEEGALIGFAGPRVIEQTIGQSLPEGFQRAQFQMEHGFVDRIVKRETLREELEGILKLHGPYFCGLRARKKQELTGIIPEEIQQMNYLWKMGNSPNFNLSDSKKIQIRTDRMSKKKKRSSWDRLQLARDSRRPRITDYIDALFEHFIPLYGDRLGGEDSAIYGGIAIFAGIPVTVIGHRKGRTLEENVSCNFGMAEPEGYRKSLRLMKQAERFGRPVITLIDTPGAYPGINAEEHGISVAIAENLEKMSRLKVPVIAIVTGEGSSGGALALAVADRVCMMENAVYSILSPEGFASILWKDSSKSKEACDVMKMTAQDLLERQLIDRIIPEPEGGIQEDEGQGMKQIRSVLLQEMSHLISVSPEVLIQERYEKFRCIEGSMRPVRVRRTIR